MDRENFFSEDEYRAFEFILENAEKLDQLDVFKERLKKYAENYLKQFQDEMSEHNFSKISKYEDGWVECGACVLSEHIRTNNDFFNGFLEMQVGWQSKEIYISVSGYSLKNKNGIDLDKVVSFLESILIKVINKKTYQEDEWIQIFSSSSKYTPQKLANEFRKILEKIES